MLMMAGVIFGGRDGDRIDRGGVSVDDVHITEGQVDGNCDVSGDSVSSFGMGTGGDRICHSGMEALDDPLDWLGSDPLSSFRFMALVDWTTRVAALPTAEYGGAVVSNTDATRNPGNITYLAPDAGEWRLLVTQYDWPADEALRIISGPTATCPTGESNGRADAISPWGDFGLMQIHCASHWDKLLRVAGTYDCMALLDPAVNLAVGWLVYEAAGYTWSPWGCRP